MGDPSKTIYPDSELADTPTSTVSSGTDDDFIVSTGLTRMQAARLSSAILNVIGAAMPDTIGRNQQLNAALNVLGMAASEVVAASGANETQRGELRTSLNEFVTQTSEHVAKHLESLRDLATFTVDTADGQTNTATGEAIVAN